METVKSVILTFLVLLLLTFCYNVCERAKGQGGTGCATAQVEEETGNAVQGVPREAGDSRTHVR